MKMADPNGFVKGQSIQVLHNGKWYRAKIYELKPTNIKVIYNTKERETIFRREVEKRTRADGFLYFKIKIGDDPPIGMIMSPPLTQWDLGKVVKDLLDLKVYKKMSPKPEGSISKPAHQDLWNETFAKIFFNVQKKVQIVMVYPNPYNNIVLKIDPFKARKDSDTTSPDYEIILSGDEYDKIGVSGHRVVKIRLDHIRVDLIPIGEEEAPSGQNELKNKTVRRMEQITLKFTPVTRMSRAKK